MAHSSQSAKAPTAQQATPSARMLQPSGEIQRRNAATGPQTGRVAARRPSVRSASTPVVCWVALVMKVGSRGRGP